MSNTLKANIISLFLALNAKDQKKVLAELQQIANKGNKITEGGKNISEEEI